MADHNSIIPGENWKPIPDYPGYEVSDHGRVRSYWKRIAFGDGGGNATALHHSPVRILRPGITAGYLRVVLVPHGRTYKKNRLVHRLVLEAFIGPCPHNMVACHNDGDRMNNHLSNLRYDTRVNNELDKYLHGTEQVGETSAFHKLTWEKVCNIRKLFSDGINRNRLAKMFDVSHITITRVVNNESWII